MLSIARYASARQFPCMSTRHQDPSDSAVSTDELSKRIDDAANRAGITTQDLATAAGVTWTAAKRWRRGTRPRVGHLRAVARVLGMTLDELVGESGYEPDFPAWIEFLDTPTGRELSPDDRRWLATQWFPDDQEPTVSTYLVMAEARRTMRARTD